MCVIAYAIEQSEDIFLVLSSLKVCLRVKKSVGLHKDSRMDVCVLDGKTIRQK